jgi:2-polyprenyl-3-methyl-5-hydroxy-6-metoxy-1,4-benzoquinol methylase
MLGNVNMQIWDSLYEGGNYIHYPSEVFVQLYFRIAGNNAPSGSFLDYGCGSGNNSEFLARQGWTVVGTDISARALEVQKKRLMDLGKTSAQVQINPALALQHQLGVYDNILCWDCLCYNTLPKAKQDAQDISAALRPKGLLFINMPTLRHEFASTGLKLEDGSYMNQRKGTRQEGAIMAIPKDVEDLISWFPDLVVVQQGHFIFDFNGYKSFMFFVGRKPESA